MIAAVVPAAGRSERMGRPKLILSVGGRAVIERVASALLQGGADLVVVVTAPPEEPGAQRIADESRKAGAVVVVAQQVPPDMRASVELGLSRLREGPTPRTVLLAPADSPGISLELVARVLAAARDNPAKIVVPTVAGKGGHPIALPWRFAEEVFRLPKGVGVNALMKQFEAEVVALDVNDPGAAADLDTPADYDRWVLTLGG